jgi:hypothetical protein
MRLTSKAAQVPGEASRSVLPEAEFDGIRQQRHRIGGWNKPAASPVRTSFIRRTTTDYDSLRRRSKGADA